VSAQREDAPQHELGDRLGVALCVRERERRPPRPAEHLPPLDPEVPAQQLDVGDEVPRRVETQVGLGRAHVRRRAAAAALVEQHDPVALRVEEPPLPRRRPAPRTAVQEHHRLALGVAGLLPIHALPVAGEEEAGLVRLDLGIEDAVEVRRPGG